MRVLIVHDDRATLDALRGPIEAMGYQVACVMDEKLALAACRKEPFDAVLVDWDQEEMRSLPRLEEIKRLQPRCSIVLLATTRHASAAVETMGRGPYDCLAEPFRSRQIRWVLGRIERLQKLERGIVALETRLGSEVNDRRLHTTVPAMERIYDVALEAAASDASILLLGEPGTGRAHLARTIHRRSDRRQGAMATIHCALRPREALESELFGHVQGALPGADANTHGRIAAADGGTLYLDSLGEMPQGTQRKLLRFLQEGSYQRLGESKLCQANVRIVSSADKGLAAAAVSGRFSSELYEKLSAISLTLPPLRERLADLETFATEYLQRVCERSVKRVRGFSADALAAMARYEWPGNFRELQIVIERAVMLTKGVMIEATDLPESIQCGDEIRVGGRATLEQLENEHLRRIIASASSLDEAAAILGINPATLFRKRRRLNSGSRGGDAREPNQ